MKKVLLIEDDPLLRGNTIEFLKEEGFVAYAASDGAMGVQMAMEYVPDLILCDIMMPRMDGYEVLKALQVIPSTSSIPFIFLTAKTQKEEIRLGMQLGVDDYITKPYSFDELLTSIKVRIEKFERVINTFENKYLSMVENPLVGVFIIHDFVFKYMNTKFIKMLGFATDTDINKKSFTDFIFESEIADILGKMELCRKNIIPNLNMKCRFIDKDSNAIPVSLFASSVKLKGEVCIIGYIQQQNTFEAIGLSSDSSDYLTEISEVVQKMIEYHKIKPEDLIHVMRNKNAKKEIKNPDNLTKREIEIVKVLAEGLTNKEIAEKLFISQRTVDTHKANVLMKTGSKHVGALIMYALKNNIIEQS